jgi:RNA polymerase sigma-70 factor (ECF subfamily)
MLPSRDASVAASTGVIEPVDGRSDATLVAQIAESRDRQAFRELFKRYAPRLKAYFTRTGCAPDQCDDLVQEAFLAVLRHAGHYQQERAAVSTWLFTIARNRHVDALRKNRARSADQSSLDPEALDPDELVEARRLAEKLRNAIDALPQEQAAVVRGAYFSCETSSELADRLQVPAGTVKSRLRLDIRFLQQRVSEE